jgi:hypothetical protein
MRSTLFWDFAQRTVVIPHRRFGTTYRSHIKGLSSHEDLDCLTFKDGTDRLSQNVSMELTFYAGYKRQKGADLVKMLFTFRNV